MNKSIFVVEGKSYHYHLDLTLMSPETLEALKGSIRKWERMVKSTKAVDRGPWNCPLCEKYHDHACVGCPVRSAAGDYACRGTPYDSWIHHQRTYHGVCAHKSRHPHCKECLKTARDMLAFLIDLLPVGD